MGGVVTKVERAVRESDFALFAGRYGRIDNLSPHAEAGIPVASVMDDDAVWKGMVSELASFGDVLPKSLECVSGEVSAIL